MDLENFDAVPAAIRHRRLLAEERLYGPFVKAAARRRYRPFPDLRASRKQPANAALQQPPKAK
jgi:hypothetical protein